MPPSRAQAERTRREAAADVQKDGARVTILYEGGQVDPATGVRPATADRVIRTYALIGGYGVALVDGQRVHVGDVRVTIADLALAGLSVSGLRSVADEAETTGYWLFMGGDRERHPSPEEPLAPGVRRLAIVALEGTVYEGGYPVLRTFQARG